MAMKAGRKLRVTLTLQSLLFGVLLIALVTLLAYAAGEYRKEWDVTRAARNTLSQATLDVLRQLEGPLELTAYAVTQDPTGADVHKLIEQRVRPYLKAKPDARLTLVDPRQDPKRAEAAGVRGPNELVIEYKKRIEHMPLREFNEQDFANALTRLKRGATSLVLWLDGHGERKLDGTANQDLGEFGRQLQQKGVKLLSLNLAIAQDVPANAAMLVIATPQSDLQPSEVEKLQRYVQNGGSLLWLLDPAPLHGLQPLAELFGLVLTPGVVVDPALKPPRGPPVFAAAASYGPHPITASFRHNTLFPYARQIGTDESDEWRITPLIEVAPRGWVEMSRLEDNPTFDKARDLPGPITIAAAFERTVNEKQQRVIVVGNGSFLANSFLGSAGNLQLGVAMVNWLTSQDDLVAIDPRPAPDTRVELDQVSLYVIAFSFLVGLPLLFVLTGVFIWWRRRKAA